MMVAVVVVVVERVKLHPTRRFTFNVSKVIHSVHTPQPQLQPQPHIHRHDMEVVDTLQRLRKIIVANNHTNLTPHKHYNVVFTMMFTMIMIIIIIVLTWICIGIIQHGDDVLSVCPN